MALREYRWELWVPAERQDDAIDRLLDKTGDWPFQGPVVPSASGVPERVVLYVVARPTRRNRRELDEIMARAARDHEGHAFRVPIATLHMSVTPEA